MSLKPETAIHRLRKLYRDAHHCEPATDQHAIDWARKPELWAEHKIRFGGWSYHATEATVRECRRLVTRAERLVTQQQEPQA